MSPKSDPVLQAQREATRLLKRYLDAPEEERTPLLRALAEILVGIRERFLREDGSPDWNGRTHPYRAWVREVYSGANVPADDRATIQSAIRYHVGAVLRERLDEETLGAYGLLAQTPRERSLGRRQTRSAMLSALTARDVAGGALPALLTALRLLTTVKPDEVANLPASQYAVADETLADLERRVRGLRRRIGNAGGAAAASSK